MRITENHNIFFINEKSGKIKAVSLLMRIMEKIITFALFMGIMGKK